MDKIMEERLALANDLREKERYGDSSKLYTECLPELIKSNDYEGLIHCLGGQSLIYKILSRQTQNSIYKNLTLSFAAEAFKVGQENEKDIDKRILSIAYSCYADALLAVKKAEEALPLFKKALEVTTADLPEKGSLKAHIGMIKYSLGQKEEGKKEMETALEDIRTGDLSASYIVTWETGVLNGLAMISALEGDKQKALSLINESLDRAKSNNLPIRAKDAEDIQKEIVAGTHNFSL